MFLIRPTPLLGESLSSWRQRAGIANGFRRFPRPEGFRSWVEPDRLPAQEELTWLQNEYLLSAETISALSLEAIGGNIVPEFGKTTKLRWVIPCANRKPGSPGGSCCPLCFAEDDVPHFRLAWRFAFLTHCPTHGSLLIDRCLACSSQLWPTNIRNFSNNQLHDFCTCQSCGKPLHDHAIQPLSSNKLSNSLWDCATESIIPSEVKQATNASEVFSALWAMCQLLLRGRSLHAWNHLPIELEGNALLQNLANNTGAVELFPINLRQGIIRAGYWLLADWPFRFIKFAKDSDISRQHFSPSWMHHPKWMNEIIEESLSVRKIGITKGHVNLAIDSIKNSGKVVSKSAVRRVLGVSGAQAINEVISHRRTGTICELMVLCRKFEQRLASVTCARDQRATLIRDYLIFLVSVLVGQKIEDVCKMSPEEVSIPISGNSRQLYSDATSYLLIQCRAKQLTELYTITIRPQLLADNQENCGWFIGRYGNKLAGHTVRERVAKMMRTGFPRDLWNSADVFLKLFHASSSHINST